MSTFCDDDHFNNAFFLMKKTVDFLTSEYGMHFVILSAYQSDKSHSMTSAYTSPGPAAKFFDESYSTIAQQPSPNGNNNGNALMHNWNEFVKNYCFQNGVSQSFANIPPYTEFLKSQLDDEKTVKESSFGVPELPEPPSNILSETLYYCNGEFVSEEDSETEADSSSAESSEKEVEDLSKKSSLVSNSLKRKSLQDVSDQLAKKAAVGTNYYRTIYPAAPKLVTPNLPADTVLNLSRNVELLRSAAAASAAMNANQQQQTAGNGFQPTDLSSLKPLLTSVTSLLTQPSYLAAAAALNQHKQNQAAALSSSLKSSSSSSLPSSTSTTLASSGKPSPAHSSSDSSTSSPLALALGSGSSASIKSLPKEPSLVIDVGQRLTGKSPGGLKSGENGLKKGSSKAPPSPMKSSAFNANGTPKQMWPCTVCSKEFASQSTMKRHLNHFHLKVHSYTCSYCQEVFYRKDKLVAHIKIKHGIDTSRSARLVSQVKTSPNGSTTTNSTLSPISPPTSSNNSHSPTPTLNLSPSGGATDMPSPVPSSSPSTGTFVVQPMTPPCSSSGVSSPQSHTPSPLPLTISEVAPSEACEVAAV